MQPVSVVLLNRQVIGGRSGFNQGIKYILCCPCDRKIGDMVSGHVMHRHRVGRSAMQRRIVHAQVLATGMVAVQNMDYSRPQDMVRRWRMVIVINDRDLLQGQRRVKREGR